MGYRVIRGDEQAFAAPSWLAAESARTRETVELRDGEGLQHSQANLWRFPAGAQGRRHREPVQEEVFCVLEGTLTVLLGEPPERFDLPPRSLVVLEPGTPIHLKNESADDVIFFAYGAPSQPSSYKAEILEP